MQLLLALLACAAALSCDTGEYANTYLGACLLCPTGCLQCCDENLCSSCDSGTRSPK